MEKTIDWSNECEKIAAELVDDVCRKFVDDQEIKLYMSRPIGQGNVYGLLAKTPLYDEWHTVVIEYSVIPRCEIRLDRERLFKRALEDALSAADHPDIISITDIYKHRRRISNRTEWGIASELSAVFSETAVANPEKYPVYQTHGHTRPRFPKELYQ